jgi:UDP-glucose 4-epimerase
VKFLVTGALGHIGSRLVRDLPIFFDDCEIIMLDNMMTQRYCSLFNLPHKAKYSFVEGDLTSIALEELLAGVDVVVHLAAITDAAGSFDKAEQVEKNNYDATKRLAEACIRSNVKLITISSTSVYGTQANEVDEDCAENDLKPQSPYAVTKLKEERLIQYLSAEKGLLAGVCRFGTIFGGSPGMRFHTAVNKFCWQAAMDVPVTVWSTAYDQKRPYLDLGDACRAIAHMIRGQLFDGKIYNVITMNATVRDIVETIKLFSPNLKINFVDSKIMNQLSYEVKDSRIRGTGFIPEGNLQRSISEVMQLISPPNSLG